MTADAVPAPSARASSSAVIDALRAIVGSRHVLVADADTRRFATGYRFGSGAVRAVVRPATLVELWRTLQTCVEASVIIIMQAANTGLTGGSTPHGDYDRDVVLINTLRIKGIHPIDEGRQVICLPGATLYELEAVLKPYGREPHSVIGSSCIGASVFGGICNNSGGSLVQRGPAYTELALYARMDEQGKLHLVNHLGVALGDDLEDILRRVESGAFDPETITHDCARQASDHHYCDHVRKVDDPTPARFNADPTRLYEASGSAGKVALLAARLDTFPRENDTATFYIGTNSVADLAQIRQDILRNFTALPVAGEYIHRDAFDLAAQYGKDTVIAIERLGTDRLPSLFALKAKVDAWARKLPFLPDAFSDHLMQAGSRLFGDHLPERMWTYRDRYEHHLILKMSGDGIAEARAYLQARYPNSDGDVFECTGTEATKAFLHRFAVAGAAVRYRAVHNREVEDIVAIDVALRRNDRDWFETLPEEIDRHIIRKLYYGHFFCHVFHQDYIVAKGVDPVALEHAMLGILDERGAEYPAEHNVGHLYTAKEPLVQHYRALDPCNSFNPGIGNTPRGAHWR
ncbi:D-lactate dehydrogenase [Sphingobium subterraneum]|uniref:Quinone-dependent D-lactate dehydrogenase n=1 Tax=Sphingobium subterraneum TaxID=627688 RepID=A0A841J3A9_9SPHN|nr:D-lactate dehydrogenase [Sphingobium subterraneum]MBB6122998.1 D-lactate dehydrogenase [Sphingobium subterraneum]